MHHIQFFFLAFILIITHLVRRRWNKTNCTIKLYKFKNRLVCILLRKQTQNLSRYASVQTGKRVGMVRLLSQPNLACRPPTLSAWNSPPDRPFQRVNCKIIVKQSVGRKMASSDFLENAISSKIDEKSLNDLTNSLESSLPNSQSVTNSIHSDGKNLKCWKPCQRVKIVFAL